MAHTAHGPAFHRLIDEHAPARQIAGGFIFTEGPVWHPVEQSLYFSDMPGDVRRRWDRGGVREVMRPSNKANGLTFDAELNLLACEHATSSLARFRADGRREVLVSHAEGRELNSPNDVCVHSSGAIYFTDPNGIALEASWWSEDPTLQAPDYTNDRYFKDPDPVPAFEELRAGGLRAIPRTTLVDEPTADYWVAERR